MIFKDLDKTDLKKIAQNYNLDESSIEELLEDYDTSLGARLLTRKIRSRV